MAFGQPPVTVAELLVSAKKTAANIAANRDAMAQVAANLAHQIPPTPKEGVSK